MAQSFALSQHGLADTMRIIVNERRLAIDIATLGFDSLVPCRGALAVVLSLEFLCFEFIRDAGVVFETDGFGYADVSSRKNSISV